MDMNIDLKDIKKTIQERKGSKRSRQSVYVLTALWREFKAACAPVSASKVLEEFMQKVVEESRRRK